MAAASDHLERRRITATDCEGYRDPRTGAENSLRHFVDRHGQHVVIHDHAPGEAVEPNVWRHATAAEARQRWRDLRARLRERGYTERVY